jgi:cysteine synthase A
VVMSVATDGADLYASEIRRATARYFGNRLDAVSAGEAWGRSMLATTTDHMLELNHYDRKRIFNLGYFTWVEQQGVPLDEFNVRADQSFWDGLLELVPAWDAMIADVNAQSGAAVALNA